MTETLLTCSLLCSHVIVERQGQVQMSANKTKDVKTRINRKRLHHMKNTQTLSDTAAHTHDNTQMQQDTQMTINPQKSDVKQGCLLSVTGNR